MKRFLILISLLALFSCMEEETPDPLRTDNTLFDSLTSSRWAITLFEDEGQDETTLFDGLSFTFLTNGQVEVYRDTQLLDVGIWETDFDDGRAELELEFTNPLFEDLSEDWYQIRLTQGRIDFREDSGGSEDRLNFTRL